MLPDILPVADADDRTYTVVLFAVPPVSVMVTLLPKPLVALVETSKPVGAVEVILPVR